MYKVGGILLSLTLAFNILVSVLFAGYMVPLFKFAGDSINEIQNNAEYSYNYDEYDNYYEYDDYDDFYYDNEYFNDFLGVVSEVAPYIIGLSVLSYVNLGYSIILSIFANNMYFKHCIKKINEINSLGFTDSEQRQLALISKGGTAKPKAIALGVVVPIVSFIIGAVIIISAFMVVL